MVLLICVPVGCMFPCYHTDVGTWYFFIDIFLFCHVFFPIWSLLVCRILNNVLVIIWSTIYFSLLIQENFLRKTGDNHPHFGFLQLLSKKCLFNIFSSEHVQCILDQLLSDKLGNKNLEDSSVKLLSVRAIVCYKAWTLSCDDMYTTCSNFLSQPV